MLDTITHNLKTPLNGILLKAQTSVKIEDKIKI